MLCPFFGIYEDDYTEFIANLSFSRDQLFSYIQWCFSSCLPGRPLGWMLNGVVGYLSKGDTLTGGYRLVDPDAEWSPDIPGPETGH